MSEPVRIPGPECETCGKDVFFNTVTGRLICGAGHPYVPPIPDVIRNEPDDDDDKPTMFDLDSLPGLG